MSSVPPTGTAPPEEALPPPAEGTPLYVHLPFCTAKCHYCDFFSVPAEDQDLPAMIDAILVEARHRAPRSPRTLFLGGGTPSLFAERDLARLLDGLDELTGWRSSVIEATAECNPESLDRQKASFFLSNGIPRLSIGVQTLDEPTLELFGRVHRANDALRALEDAHAAGVERLSADLIYAWPGQTVAQLEHDLASIIPLIGGHMSAYNLTYEEDTRFLRWKEQGRLQPLPEERELELLDHLERRLTDSGLERYEVSNFSLKGHQCVHNQHYWRCGDYVGLGPGAVSKSGTRRSGNPRGIAVYHRWITSTGHATQWVDAPGDAARLGEAWWLGLRMEQGISPSEAASRSESSIDQAVLDPLLDELLDLGLIQRVGERYQLTHEGLRLADAVAGRFLRALGVEQGA